MRKKLRIGDSSLPALRPEFVVDTQLSLSLNPSAAAPTAWGDARQTLQTLRNRIRATLCDAEQGRIKRESTALWVKDLKYLADDIDDALDDFDYEQLSCKVVAAAAVGDSSRGSSSDPDRSSNQFYVTMACKVGYIWRRFEEIKKEHKDLDVRTSWSTEPNSSPVRETASLMTDPEVIGRDDVKEEIIDFLVGGTPEESLSVLAIVGIGGVGKTTLARSVYHDDRVGGCFHRRIWVHVSSDFDVKRVTRQILEHVSDPRLSLHQMDNLNVLQEALAKALADKSFLLVLDDMWFEDRVMDNLVPWEALCAPLIQGRKGSKIVVTTRSAQLAGVKQLAKTIPLAGLDSDNSWSLFKKHAFLGGDSEGHPNLEDIGKRIVEKLKGVPLAVAAIGSMLLSESEESEWIAVLESQLWELEQGDGGMLPSLRLSYEHLPPHLRPCFAYVSVFPKGYRFDRLQLIQLWMAMGYIQSHGNKRMEDVGSDYLDCLLARSLIHNFGDKYVVHDLLHDLGRFILLNDVCAIEGEKLREISSDDQQHRHLSLVLNKQPELCELEKLQNFKKLRTLFFAGSGYCSFEIPCSLFMNLTCLRVLTLSGVRLEYLPDSIGNLRHLRYLDLSNNNFITDLPESLCSLYMLQTLKLDAFYSFHRKLPTGMSNLVNLRHLGRDGWRVPKICGIGKLVHLQKLELLSICERDDEGNKIDELRDMDELRGTLCIRNLQRVVSREEASRANLRNKKHIKNLELEWRNDSDVSQRSSESEEAVLDALLPPPGLKKLSIIGYDGVKFPSWMNHCQTVSGLESISLKFCRRCDNLPPFLGHLRQIKSLDICFFPQLEDLPLLPATLVKLYLGGVKLNAVPGLECMSKLQELELHQIPDLKELPPLPITLRILRMNILGLQVLPDFCQKHNSGVTADAAENGVACLREFRIVSCRKLRVLGGVLRHHLPYLEVLRIQDCEELQSWPDEEFFQASLLSLRDEFSVENCPKLKALPEGSAISSSLRKLYVGGCPDFADKSIFVQLQKNLLNPQAVVSVEKRYRDLASCFEGALDQMRAVHFLKIKTIDGDRDEFPFTLNCRVITVDSGVGWWVTLEISRRKSDDDESYYRCCNSTLWACLRHQQLRSSLILENMPSGGLLHPQGGEEATTLFSTHPPSLVKLSFCACRDMERLPVVTLLCHLTKLQQLTIKRCPEVTLPSVEEAVRSLPSLVRLAILGCPKISSHPTADARALVLLEESSSPWRPSPSPITPPSSTSQTPPLLRTLVTDEVGLLADTQFDRNHLTLRDLQLWRYYKESFPVVPEELFWPRSLRVLSVFDCSNLEELPPDFCTLFPSLRALFIRFCPKLRRIPQTGLPASLEALIIVHSPCWVEEEDWPKVPHVRLISIDGTLRKGSYSDYLQWDNYASALDDLPVLISPESLKTTLI